MSHNCLCAQPHHVWSLVSSKSKNLHILILEGAFLGLAKNSTIATIFLGFFMSIYMKYNVLPYILHRQDNLAN